MILYFLNEADEIIYASFSGDVGLDDIRDFYQDLTKLYDRLSVIRILQDEQNANFINTDLILKNSQTLLKILTTKFNRVKIGVLQNKPIETAYSYLFIEQLPDKTIDFRIFSKEENARNWLSK